MYLDYLIDNKLYLKEDISIECGEIVDLDGLIISVSGSH